VKYLLTWKRINILNGKRLGRTSLITIPKLAEIIGKSVSAIKKQIKKLQTENKIERIGPDKGGYWRVIK